jgi:hypothetical protein
MAGPRLTSRRVEAPDDLDEINHLYYERGWTDGLPIVPPTEDRVARMVAASGRAPDEVIGRLAPGLGTATVEKIAVNAVMAGCRPEYFPVVLAGVKGVAQEDFNLGGVQTTTGGPAPLLIVNGPIRRALHLNSGPNLFGPGWRANATIGRALRLVLINIAGGRPGEMDKATHAHPGKYAYCIAENEEESPWEPLHTEQGLAAERSTATVIGCFAPQTAATGDQRSAHALLRRVAGGLGGGEVGWDNQILVVLGPEHAREIAAAGFTKRDVRQFLYMHSRRPVPPQRTHNIVVRERVLPMWVDPDDPNETVPAVTWPENIIIIVAGGDGRLSSIVLPWTSTHAQTVAIDTLEVVPTSYRPPWQT